MTFHPVINLYHSHGNFSKLEIGDIFSYFFFPEKRLWYFFAWNIKAFFVICMKYQSLFSGENKKKYFKMMSAGNFVQHAKR